MFCEMIQRNSMSDKLDELRLICEFCRLELKVLAVDGWDGCVTQIHSLVIRITAGLSSVVPCSAIIRDSLKCLCGNHWRS